MKDQNWRYFELLKKAIVRRLQMTYPAASENIEEWKGQTIIFFQDDLREKVKEHISERWFYNHMKSGGAGLPRIDILNLLSRYAGYVDWQDFVFKNKEFSSEQIIKDRSNRYFYLVPLLAILVVGVIYGIFKLSSTREYQICFVNADDLSKIMSDKTQIELLDDKESSITMFADSTGCIRFKTNKIKVRFVVNSPYYKTDTIDRVLRKFSREETIKLRTDDYALMLHYFSTSNVTDWKKRREQLDMIFADSARIYELSNNGDLAIELYDKWEFINKLTVPTRSLAQIEILGSERYKEKIVSLRFKQHNR